MSITAHMVVKNEDQWIYFAIASTLPYASRFLITDTGSTDNTVSIIRSFKSKKIVFTSKPTTKPRDITMIRQQQLDQTRTNWFWVIDGDEIYPRKTSKEIVKAVNSKKYEGIVVRRHDLLGDIYHAQRESVGEYNLFGQKGHIVLRLLNKSIVQGLYVKGTYPLEGYYDKNSTAVIERDKTKYYFTQNRLYHAMYLKRSSLGANLSLSLNRSKYKIEKGLDLRPSEAPEVFFKPTPKDIQDPLKKRSPAYEVAARIITPIKELKRKIL